MPTCAAVGCGARSSKGDVLRIFPRKDLRRRQIWIDRVNRPGWNPTRYSALCELHFDKNQWELPRVDTKRKLKSSALPSIFSVEHPSNHHIVAKDHAYSYPRLRKLYDDIDLDEETSTMPIEHIKVEVDENENFTPECSEVEAEEEQIDKEPENIQCTPDIFLYPRRDPPEPLEMVHCEEEVHGININDPSNDPLAISADDVEKSKEVEPNFPHTTKYVFVTNNKAYLKPGPLDVTGEPQVAATATSTLKVRSPLALFKPTSAALDVEPVPSGPFLAELLRTPATPKSGLVRNPVRHILPKPPKPPVKLMTKKQLIKIPRSILNRPIVISESGQLDINKNVPSVTEGDTSILPTYQNKNIPSSDKEVKLVLANGKKLDLKLTLNDLKPFGNKKYSKLIRNLTKVEVGNRTSMLNSNSVSDSIMKDPTEKLKSIMSFAEVENIFLEHQYSEKILWKPLTMHGLKLNSTESEQSSQESDSCSNKTEEKHTVQKKRLPFLLPKNVIHSDPANSSVLVLNPFAQPFSPPKTLHNADKFVPYKKRKIELYDCKICKISFLTLPTLELHMAAHKDNEVVYKDVSKRKAELNILDSRKEKEEKKTGQMTGPKVKKANRKKALRPLYKFENSLLSIPNLMVFKKSSKNKHNSAYSQGKKNSYSENFISKKGRLCKKSKKLIFEAENTSSIVNTKNVSSSDDLTIISEDDLCRSKIVEKNEFNKSQGKNLDKQNGIDLKRQPIVLIPKLDISKISNIRINNLSEFIYSNIETPKSFDKKNIKRTKNPKTTLICFKNRGKDMFNVENCSSTNKISKNSAKPHSKRKDIKVDVIDIQSFYGHREKRKRSYKIQADKKEMLNGNINKNISFKNSKALRSSFKNKCELKTELVKTSAKTIDKFKTNAGFDYKCKLCPKRFAKSFQLRRHVTCDHKVVKHKPFRCCRKSCGRAFETKRELDKHSKTHRKTHSVNKTTPTKC